MNNFVVKCIIINLGLINKIVEVKCLTEVPAVKDIGIMSTEAAIRHTMNTLFHHLQPRGVRNKPKLIKYSIVHNNLISITLQDNDILKKIANLTRVDNNNVSNITETFIAIINELLNEDYVPNNEDLNRDDYVMTLINDFLINLEQMKVKYDIGYDQSDINSQILKVLKNDQATNVPMHNRDYTDVLIENEFWRPSGRRIFREKRTNIKHYPFMASVQIMNQFYCAGSIIKSDLVISAASCLQLAYNNRFFRENPAFLAVRVGSSYFDGAGEKIPVLEVYFHPSYDPRTLRHNLCVMRLLRRLKFKGRRIKKIDIDREASSLPVTTDGITVVGWGSKGASNIVKGSAVDQMSFAVLDFYPLSECREVYSSQYVTRTNFCAGFFSRGGGACNVRFLIFVRRVERDVGGPGIVNGVLTGVISFGSPTCGAENSPTVFMKVGYYSKWIDDILDMSVPYAKQRTTTTTPRTIYTTMFKHTKHPPYTVTPIAHDPIEETTQASRINIQVLRDNANQTEHSNTDLDLEEDPELFKEFVKTLFGSKEVQDLEGTLANIRAPGNGRNSEDTADDDDTDNEILERYNPTMGGLMEPVKLETTQFTMDAKSAVTDRIRHEPITIGWNEQTSGEEDDEELSVNSENDAEMKYTVLDKNLSVDSVTVRNKELEPNHDDNNKNRMHVHKEKKQVNHNKDIIRINEDKQYSQINDDSDTKQMEDEERKIMEKKSKKKTAEDESDDSEESVEIMLEAPNLSYIQSTPRPESLYIEDLNVQHLPEVARTDGSLDYVKSAPKPNYTYKNESVLTLLYLSDSDKKNSKLNTDDLAGQINIDTMHKVSKDAKSYEILSKQDLYDILQETFMSEAAGKLFNKKHT